MSSKFKVRNKILLILALSLVGLFLKGQGTQLHWAKKMGGSGNDIANSIAIDGAGNVYTTGHFTGTADFNPGVGVFNLSSTSGFDIFVSKLDNMGNFVWAKAFYGNAFGKGLDIDVDKDGNVYTTGYFAGTVDFNPGTGIYNLTGASSPNYGIYISKLNTNGNFVWAKKIGTGQSDKGNAIKIDSMSNVYVTGNFYGIDDFDPGSGAYTMTSSGLSDAFILKLNSAGIFNWAKRIGGNDNDNGLDLALNKHGNLFIIGRIDGLVDLDPGAAIYNLGANGVFPSFILELDPTGNFVFAKAMNNTDPHFTQIVIDASDNLVITGFFIGPVDFDPSSNIFTLTSGLSNSTFILKLDSLGNFILAKEIIGDSYVYSKGIATDKNNNIYSTGYFNGTCDFAPGPGSFNLASTTPSSQAYYISKLDSLGSFLWAKTFYHTNSAITSQVSGNSIVVDSFDNLYLAGDFSGTIDFDPGINTFNMIGSGGDVFVHKIGQCIISTSMQTDTACDSILINGQTYTASGVYTQLFSNVIGCDSIHTLNISIQNSSSYSLTQSACSSYFFNGQTYTQSGSYAQTLTNSIGCDSVITLNLTLNSTSISFNQLACNSYIFNGITYTTSGIYTQTFVNTVGCDSSIILSLTINNPTSNAISQTVCNSYSLNAQTYTTSGMYTQTLINAQGCDSNITLNLTINFANTGTIQSGTMISAIASGASYQWVNCPAYSIISGATNQSYTATSNGDYAVIVTENGCTDTSICLSVIGVGIEDDYKPNQIQISPNPTKNIIQIFSDVTLNNASVKLLSMNGKALMQNNNLTGKKFELDISSFSKGIYFVEIIAEEKSYKQKIVKE